MPRQLIFVLVLFIGRAVAQTGSGLLEIDFSQKLGPMRINQMALGQGGLSEKPMWADRIPDIRALHPAIIRLFIQEYFDLLPEKGRYHFETLDHSVQTIVQAGAKPLMCICFKPRALFPRIDQDVVEPTDYKAWEDLIFELVKHYRDQNTGIRYWEIGNEPDIGEDGGCPYRFKAESYARYYLHTASAIQRADPDARIGGPALANSRSPLLPALLSSCRTNGAPLNFVSWHIYSSDPKAVRETVEYVKNLLQTFPEFKLETFLDEWNMDLMNPPLDPAFQPCFVAEAIWQMKEAGLDYSCYYHIRDWYVSFDAFTPFMSDQGTAFMTRWWNRMPQFDGLFDYQNRVRPSYFTFKLLSRLAGEGLHVSSSEKQVHAFASHDSRLRMYNVLLWNFSGSSNQVRLVLRNLPKEMRSRHLSLDARVGSDDENARLHPDSFQTIKPADPGIELNLEPWAVHYWSFE